MKITKNYLRSLIQESLEEEMMEEGEKEVGMLFVVFSKPKPSKTGKEGPVLKPGGVTNDALKARKMLEDAAAKDHFADHFMCQLSLKDLAKHVSGQIGGKDTNFYS